MLTKAWVHQNNLALGGIATIMLNDHKKVKYP